MTKKSRSDLRILLMQIRDEARVREEEHRSFARFGGLSPDQIDILNVFDTPEFPANRVDGYDALWVGGASEASVLEPETYSFLDSCQGMLLYCLERDIPVFASCFGFQLGVVALGGTLVRDEDGFEMGTIPIQLTAAAQHDPLFHDVPNGFLAVSVHRERAPEVPPNCEVLAYTSICCHGFRVHNKQFWGFQFHPELDRPTLVERLTIFKQCYTDNDDHLDRVLGAIVDTPESNQLLNKFVERILLDTNSLKCVS